MCSRECLQLLSVAKLHKSLLLNMSLGVLKESEIEMKPNQFMSKQKMQRVNTDFPTFILLVNETFSKM